MALAITDANFEELVATGKPMVLDFWATCADLAKRSVRILRLWPQNMRVRRLWENVT